MVTMDEDYYDVLGIQRNATDVDIQKAYREMARKFHPDLNPDDNRAKAKFQAVQKAYEVLNDPEKRKLYDQYGPSFESVGQSGPQGWHNGPGGGSGVGGDQFDFSQVFGDEFDGQPGGFSDLFRQFRRGGRKKEYRSRGNDLYHDLQISFKQGIEGGSATLTVRREGGRTETINVKTPAGIESGKKIRVSTLR